MNTNKLQIQAIKTNIGYYLNYPNDYSGNSSLTNLYFDGRKPEQTHNKLWVKTNDLPKVIEKDKSQSPINYRFELIDKTLESNKFPLKFIRDDVCIYNKSEYEWTWKDEFKHLQSLYELKYDLQPDIKENVEFEIKIVLELNQIKNYGGFSYPIPKSRWESEGYVNVTENDVKHDDIDTILFPGIIMIFVLRYQRKLNYAKKKVIKLMLIFLEIIKEQNMRRDIMILEN